MPPAKRDLVKYIDRDQLGDLDQCRQALLDIDISNIRASLILVQKIRGLAVAGASGLLALIYPNEFGTVDRYVTEALQRTDNIEEAQRILKINPARLTLDDGVVLIETFRKKAAENSANFGVLWTPKKIDMALWGCRH